MFQKTKVLIYILFYGLSVHSQNNSLVIFSASGNPFYLSVNNEQINKNAESNVKVFDLAMGWNFIEIKIPGIIKEHRLKDSILLGDNSKFLKKEFTYALVEKGEKLELEFKSVSENSGPKKPIIAIAPKDLTPLYDNSVYGNLYKAVKSQAVFTENYDETTASCKIELTDKDIEYAVKLINNSRSESDKPGTLGKIIKVNCFKTYQVKQLLELLSIDIDRLVYAKQAYTHVTDKENAITLVSVFKYQTMKESYTAFIKEQENVLKQKNLKCTEPVNSTQFEKLFSKIKNSGYEYEKVSTAKKLLVDQCISTSQIKILLELFTHDRERLEFVENAYNVLTDKENAKSLVDEFQFTETKTEFLNYISK